MIVSRSAACNAEEDFCTLVHACSSSRVCTGVADAWPLVPLQMEAEVESTVPTEDGRHSEGQHPMVDVDHSPCDSQVQ